MNKNAIYNTIGKTYDLTRKPDSEIVKKIIELLYCKPNGRFLDIGCGSGNYTGALKKNGLNIEGIDIADEMLNKAREKYPLIQFHQGDARNLPFQNSVFDGATCILATHHINDKGKVFQETFRVINKGRFVIFTSTPEQMENYWLCHYFPIMMKNAIEKMTPFDKIKDAFEQAGFCKIKQLPFFVTDRLQDLFLQSGKYRPEIYLDENVRDGISSFHLSVDQNELKQGLKTLEKDISSGEIKKIIEQYESHSGDYLFVIGEK